MMYKDGPNTNIEIIESIASFTPDIYDKLSYPTTGEIELLYPALYDHVIYDRFGITNDNECMLYYNYKTIKIVMNDRYRIFNHYQCAFINQLISQDCGDDGLLSDIGNLSAEADIDRMGLEMKIKYLFNQMKDHKISFQVVTYKLYTIYNYLYDGSDKILYDKLPLYKN